LLLLADDAGWAAQLDACLAQLGLGVSVISAPSWAAASSLFEDPRQAFLLSTPACLPAADGSPLPLILLLDAEPAEAPTGVCDWLVRGHLTPTGCAVVCAMPASASSCRTPCSAWPSRTR
jgi:hypothetical protein